MDSPPEHAAKGLSGLQANKLERTMKEMVRADQSARNRTNNEVGKSLIPPFKLSCVDCRQPASVYDHRDYLKPLDVEPVCQSCNSKLGPGKNADVLLPHARSSGYFNIVLVERIRKQACLGIVAFSQFIGFSMSAYCGARKRGALTFRMAREISLRFGIPLSRFKGADGEQSS